MKPNYPETGPDAPDVYARYGYTEEALFLTDHGLTPSLPASGTAAAPPPLLARIRARRAALEAIPRDADVDYGHEEGQVHALAAVERWIGEQAPGDAAIAQAARAYVAALRAVQAAERADVVDEVWFVAWGTVQGAEAALIAAVEGTPTEAHT